MLPFEPRRWQVEAIRAWQANGRRGVAAVVTGGGKTALAEMCIEDAWRSGPSTSAAIVVPTTALLDQWYVSVRDDLGLSPKEIATYSGEGRAKTPRRLNLLVLNTARTYAPQIARQTQMGLVVDECHRAASPENSRALEGPHGFCLGLSATPERDYDDRFQEVVVPKLGPVIYRYDYTEARRDGVITPFDLVNASVPLTVYEEVEYEKMSKRVRKLAAMAKRGVDCRDQLMRALQRRAAFAAGATLRVPVAARILDDHRGQKAIVFHEKIVAAEELASILRKRGHRVAVYHSDIGPALRRDNLRMFRNGEVDVLVTCRALDEGVNVPDASIAVIASSTASTRQRIQRLGRVLRPADGKASATVYTLYATESEQTRLLEEAGTLGDISQISWQQSTLRGG